MSGRLPPRPGGMPGAPPGATGSFSPEGDHVWFQSGRL